MKAALYARISTVDKNQNPEVQLRDLREYCAHRGLVIAAEYVDVGISGSKEKRPRLNDLMADASQGLFDVVIVWRFDRFARSTAHLLRALETFQKLNVNFVSLSESVDTGTPMGKFVFTVLGAVGELERSILIERVKAGMRNAKARGSQIGQKPADIDRTRWAALRSEGLSNRACARKLGLHESILRRALKKEVAA
jgi:DNA invertase Pin-like site-specific DNA recombinase